MQSGSQAQGASRTHFCWKEVQRLEWQGTLALQGTAIKEGKLEEEQHQICSTLSLIVLTFLVYIRFYALKENLSSFAIGKLALNYLSYECLNKLVLAPSISSFYLCLG